MYNIWLCLTFAFGNHKVVRGVKSCGTIVSVELRHFGSMVMVEREICRSSLMALSRWLFVSLSFVNAFCGKCYSCLNKLKIRWKFWNENHFLLACVKQKYGKAEKVVQFMTNSGHSYRMNVGPKGFPNSHLLPSSRECNSKPFPFNSGHFTPLLIFCLLKQA